MQSLGLFAMRPLLADLGGRYNRIESNRIHASVEGDAVQIGGSHNRFVENTIIGPQHRPYFCRKRRRSGVINSGAGNWLIGNVVTSTCHDGISVNSSSRNTQLIRNLSYDNDHDGIYVGDSTAKLVGNSALGNDAYGIEAVPGVRGGGNQASGNGNPDQCLNIACN